MSKSLIITRNLLSNLTKSKWLVPKFSAQCLSTQVVNQGQIIKALSVYDVSMNNSKRFYASKKLKSGKGSSSKKPKVELSKEEMDEVINYGELIKDMNHAIEYLRNDYNENLTLRVSPSMTLLFMKICMK